MKQGGRWIGDQPNVGLANSTRQLTSAVRSFIPSLAAMTFVEQQRNGVGMRATSSQGPFAAHCWSGHGYQVFETPRAEYDTP